MTRYFIGEIHEQNGEQEYSIPICFALEGRRNPAAKLAAVAKTWYGEPDEKTGHDYLFSGGELIARAGGYKEISKRTFEEITEFVAEL